MGDEDEIEDYKDKTEHVGDKEIENILPDILTDDKE